MTSPDSDRPLPARPGALPVPRRALTIGAHPDDAEFGSGGTVARWAREGCEVSMLIMTDGSKGSWDPEAEPGQLADIRSSEQKAAAATLGVSGELIQLGYTDGELEYSMELRRRICEWVRRLRPEVVLSHDPWKRYMLHPDHRATGWATIDGVVAARDHLFFPELGLEKHRPQAILLWAADEPDHWEDISSTLSTKIEALLCHSSQTRTTMGHANASPQARAEFVAKMHGRAADQGGQAGLELAEAFKLIVP